MSPEVMLGLYKVFISAMVAFLVFWHSIWEQSKDGENLLIVGRPIGFYLSVVLFAWFTFLGVSSFFDDQIDPVRASVYRWSWYASAVLLVIDWREYYCWQRHLLKGRRQAEREWREKLKQKSNVEK